MNRSPAWRTAWTWGVPALILLIAGWELQRQLRGMDLDALRTALIRVDPTALAWSLLATVASFGGLALIEVWALRRQVGSTVPARTAAMTGMASHALCHVLGWHALLGGMLRSRAYGMHGVVRPAVILATLATVGAAVFAGVAAALALALAMLHSNGLALAVVALLAGLAVAGARWRPDSSATPGMRVLRWMPKAFAILPVAALEAMACLAALWVLVPDGAWTSWQAFVVTCVLAQAAGVASHSPGGLGVFEAAMLAAVPAAARPGVLASIIAFRAVYGLVPFALIGLPWLLLGLPRRGARGETTP